MDKLFDLSSSSWLHWCSLSTPPTRFAVGIYFFSSAWMHRYHFHNRSQESNHSSVLGIRKNITEGPNSKPLKSRSVEYIQYLAWQKEHWQSSDVCLPVFQSFPSLCQVRGFFSPSLCTHNTSCSLMEKARGVCCAPLQFKETQMVWVMLGVCTLV